MNRFYQVRGTSGTGKTTIARALMVHTNAMPSFLADKGEFDHIKKVPENKILAYTGIIPHWDVPLVFLGNYENTCGGCDGIPSVHIVAELLKQFNEEEDTIVFMEGLMISHMLGTVGKAQADEFGKDGGILAFLDTPLDVALARIQKRRDERGDKREFNPSNTIKDYDAVELSRLNALRQGYRVRSIPHNNPLPTVHGHLDALAREIKGVAG